MADSRRASNLRMRRMERKITAQANIIAFLGSILVALALTFWLRQPDYTVPQNYVLFLLFFSVGLWVTEAVPPFAVGIMIVGFLVFTLGSPEIVQEHGIDVQSFVNTWSDSVIWLMLGGFFLAAGIKVTGLDFDLFKIATSRFRKSQSLFVLALMGATGVASMVISNTATAAMMFAAMMPLLSSDSASRNLRKAAAIGIPAGAAIGGMATIIGSPVNAVAADLVNNTLKRVEIGFLEWMYFGLPVAIVLMLVMWYALMKKYPVRGEEVPLEAILASRENDESHSAEKIEDEAVKKIQKRVVLAILGVTVILWLTERIHNIPVAAVSGIPIIGLTMLSVINSEEVRQLPWDTLMLVAGGLSLGLAIQETGLSARFVEQIEGFQVSPLTLAVVFAFATVILSNVMSNTATVSVLVPAAGMLSIADPTILPVIVGLSASCALFLPVSTPPNAIAFSTGYVELKDFRLGGTVLGLVGPIVIMLWLFLLK